MFPPEPLRRSLALNPRFDHVRPTSHRSNFVDQKSPEDPIWEKETQTLSSPLQLHFFPKSLATSRLPSSAIRRSRPQVAAAALVRSSPSHRTPPRRRLQPITRSLPRPDPLWPLADPPPPRRSPSTRSFSTAAPPLACRSTGPSPTAPSPQPPCLAKLRCRSDLDWLPAPPTQPGFANPSYRVRRSDPCSLTRRRSVPIRHCRVVILLCVEWSCDIVCDGLLCRDMEKSVMCAEGLPCRRWGLENTVLCDCVYVFVCVLGR